MLKNLLHNDNVKKGALYTFFSFVNNGISFVLLLILAHYLLPEDYGYLNLYNTFVQVVSIIIALGTNSYIGNAYFQKTRKEMYQVIMVVFLTTFAILSLLSLSLLIFPNQFSGLIGIPVLYLWMALFICFFQAFTNINLDIWRLEEKPVSYGLFSMSIAILNFIITFLFIVGMKKGWEGRIYAQMIVASTFFILSFVMMIKRGYLVLKIPPKAIVIETFLYGIPLVPHMASFWLKQGVDRYIINYFYEASEVGLYSFALNFAAVIGIIGTAFNANNSVYMYKNLAEGYEKKKHSLKRIARLMTFVFAGVFALIWLGASAGIPMILPKYTGSVKFLFPICLGAFFQCMYLLYVNYLFFYKKTKQLMYIT
ncbi:MAG: oligosaccharide flippase family protein, partial [Muribaculaceae bacterium]|nr:oligosaccharide flippase family protein [Muribaculaceae bacterium]